MSPRLHSLDKKIDARIHKWAHLFISSRLRSIQESGDRFPTKYHPHARMWPVKRSMTRSFARCNTRLLFGNMPLRNLHICLWKDQSIKGCLSPLTLHGYYYVFIRLPKVLREAEYVDKETSLRSDARIYLWNHNHDLGPDLKW